MVILNEDGTLIQQSSSNSQINKRVKYIKQTESSYDNNAQSQQSNNVSNNVSSNTSSSSSSSSSPSQYHQYLGETSCAMPEFPDIIINHSSSLPEDCNLEDIDTFRSIYREHCESFLDAVVNFQFANIENHWRDFWRSQQDNNNGDECEEEKYLSK